MDKIKIILTLIGILLGGVALMMVVGFVTSLLFYAFIFAVICLGGYIAFRLFRNPEPKQLRAPDPHKELQKVQRMLDQYKQNR